MMNENVLAKDNLTVCVFTLLVWREMDVFTSSNLSKANKREKVPCPFCVSVSDAHLHFHTSPAAQVATNDKWPVSTCSPRCLGWAQGKYGPTTSMVVQRWCTNNDKGSVMPHLKLRTLSICVCLWFALADKQMTMEGWLFT